MTNFKFSKIKKYKDFRLIKIFLIQISNIWHNYAFFAAWNHQIYCTFGTFMCMWLVWCWVMLNSRLHWGMGDTASTNCYGNMISACVSGNVAFSIYYVIEYPLHFFSRSLKLLLIYINPATAEFLQSYLFYIKNKMTVLRSS